MAIQPLPPAHQIDNVLRQLTSLRIIWDRISPGCRVECLRIAIGRLNRLAEQLDIKIAPAPGFTRNERRLLTLGLGALAAGGFFLAGVHYERHNFFAPNVARVGP